MVYTIYRIPCQGENLRSLELGGKMDMSASIPNTPHPPKQRRRVLWVAFAAVIPVFAYLLMFPVASEDIRRELGFSYTQVGSLISVVYFFFALMGPPAGLLCDRYGAKYTALAGLFAPLIASALFARFSSFPILFLAQVLVGISLGLYWTGSITLLATWYRRDSLSQVVGLLNAGAGVGLLVLTLYAPRAIVVFGWRRAYVYLAIPLLLAIACFLAVARSGRPEEVPGEGPKSEKEFPAGRIGRLGIFIILTLGFLGQGEWTAIVTLQVPYALSQGLSLPQAGMIGTLGMVTYILITYLGGWVAEKTKKTILIVRWSFLLMLTAIPLGYVTSRTGILAIFLISVGPVMFGLPAYYGIVSRISRPESVGRYTGMLATATAVGSIVYTQTNGVVLNALGVPGYRTIFWYAGLSGLLAFVLTFYPSVRRIDN